MVINREATIRWKGYDPSDLAPLSHKKVWAVCDDCGRGRWASKASQTKGTGFCHSCASKEERNGSYGYRGGDSPLFGTHPSLETREKMSENHADVSGINNPCYGLNKDGEKNPFFGRQHTEETRRKMSEIHKGLQAGEKHPMFGKHHTEETREKMSENHADFRGEKHYNWRGGISSMWSRLWKSDKYKQWRSSVFRRDDFTCQECGDSTGHNLQAHHILPRRDWQGSQYLLNVMNGITLCEKCHRLVYGKEYEFFAKYFDIANGIIEPEWKRLKL